MIDTNIKEYEKDLKEVADMFVDDQSVRIRHRFVKKEDRYTNTVTVKGNTYAFGNLVHHFKDDIERKRIEKRYAKLSLYKALSKAYGKDLPWGALTGIRPTKLAYSEIENGNDFVEFFEETMKVSHKKTMLTKSVIENQSGIYDKSGRYTDLFVFIPFCPSRCKYCSFITADIVSARKHVDEYVDALVDEIGKSAKYIKNLRSIYIGGGTPVSLEDEKLEKILKAIDRINTGVEYTVEAGRPDRITKSNLLLLKKYRVTRICINPQTFNDKTLKLIGRNHTANDIIDKYNLAKDNFSVNMDLICGLDGESVQDFMYSLNKAIELSPDNITVHTLSIKRGSDLALEKHRLDDSIINEMVEKAEEMLSENGYKPYYLYRQKYMAGNLENVGYTKPNKACIYNVDVMEETTDIIACGAGAISKKVDIANEKIIRVPAPKDVLTYIAKKDEIIEQKKLFC